MFAALNAAVGKAVAVGAKAATKSGAGVVAIGANNNQFARFYCCCYSHNTSQVPFNNKRQQQQRRQLLPQSQRRLFCRSVRHKSSDASLSFGANRSIEDLIVANFRTDAPSVGDFDDSVDVESSASEDDADDEHTNKSNDGDCCVDVGAFLAALAKAGLDYKTDVRLREFKTALDKLNWRFGPLPVRAFKRAVKPNIMLIGKALGGQLVIPDWSEFCAKLEQIFVRCSLIADGTVAAYIPTLARCSPHYWAMSVCSIDGQRFQLGDCQQPFSIQSVSKPVNYALALNELGALTHEYVSQEPSGKLFNDLSLKVFDDGSHRAKPHNPMVNSGAIVVCSLLMQLVHPHMSSSEKFDWICNYYKSMVGDEYVGFSTATFLAERETADRNYAIAYYLRENKCFPQPTLSASSSNQSTNLQSLMDLYFQLCSLEVTTQTLSRIACVLANGGLDWASEQACVDSLSVRHVLSLCHSCGMYDYSGQFAFDVGLPAKSGVSGCAILIVPNVAGFALYSPPLDAYGNSVRALAFSRALVECFNFHQYENRVSANLSGHKKIDPRKKKYDLLALDIVRLLLAASRGDASAIKRYFMSGLNMSLTDYDDRSALHAAAAEGHIEIVEFLLRNCQLPTHEPRDRWGRRPIDDAQFAGHSKVVELLERWSDEQRKLRNDQNDNRQVGDDNK